MITKVALEKLLRHEGKKDSPVLSIYLHWERSKGLNATHSMQTEMKQMLKSIEQSLKQSDRSTYGADVEYALQRLADYKPHGQSVAIFCDASENFWQTHDLNVPLRNQAWWEETPHVRPLLEILDEYERFGVILTNKTQARLFTVFWGEIEEQQDAFASGEVKHIKRPARDQLRSQLDMQRKAGMHAQWHLRNVADLMERLAQTHDFDRLVLAGPVEATGELRRLLSKRLRARVVGTLALSLQASRQQVLEATLQIEQEVERAVESELVDELITAAAKHNYARKGLKAILHELKDGRIWQLVYADGFTVRGGKCPSCAGLFAAGQKSCAYCGAKLRAVDDLVECLVERVSNDGGKVELVRGAAAQRLHSEGGIGAFLRF